MPPVPRNEQPAQCVQMRDQRQEPPPRPGLTLLATRPSRTNSRHPRRPGAFERPALRKTRAQRAPLRKKRSSERGTFGPRSARPRSIGKTPNSVISDAQTPPSAPLPQRHRSWFAIAIIDTPCRHMLRRAMPPERRVVRRAIGRAADSGCPRRASALQLISKRLRVAASAARRDRQSCR